MLFIENETVKSIDFNASLNFLFSASVYEGLTPAIINPSTLLLERSFIKLETLLSSPCLVRLSFEVFRTLLLINMLILRAIS